MDDGQGKSKKRNPADRGIFEREPGSGVWWVRYFDENRRKYREKIGPKALARKVYEKRKNEVQERRFFPERLRRRDVLLADMIDDVLKRAKGRIQAFSDYERYGRYWKEAFPNRTLAQITTGDVERYQAERIKTCAPATVNREVKFLKRVFNVAKMDKKATENPTDGVTLYKENNERVRWITDDEEARLREAMRPADWPLLSFAIRTGLRQGEQFNLRWQNVDFVSGLITIPRSKSGKLRRVEIGDDVRAILRSLPSRGRSPFVFASATGETPLDARNFVHRSFWPALKKAKIDDLHWHDARHTFASRLVMAGVDLYTVKELMGHQSITMTQRYAHLSPAHRLDAVQRLNVKRSDTNTDTKPKDMTEAPDAPAQAVGMDRKSGAPGWIRTNDHRLRSEFDGDGEPET